MFFEVWVPHPPPYRNNAGIEYALKLAEKTQILSLCLTFVGWFLVVLGAILAIAGSVLGSTILTNPPELPLGTIDTLIAHRGLLCSTGAIIFAGAGWQVLDRASAAARVASIATHAIQTATANYSNNTFGADTPLLVSEDHTTTNSSNNSADADRSAYDACVKAKAAWLEGRMNYDRLANIVESLTPHQNGK